jgi:hypothetical protein
VAQAAACTRMRHDHHRLVLLAHHHRALGAMAISLYIANFAPRCQPNIPDQISAALLLSSHHPPITSFHNNYSLGRECLADHFPTRLVRSQSGSRSRQPCAYCDSSQIRRLRNPPHLPDCRHIALTGPGSTYVPPFPLKPQAAGIVGETSAQFLKPRSSHCPNGDHQLTFSPEGTCITVPVHSLEAVDCELR